MVDNITTATPAEIDTELSGLWDERARLRFVREMRLDDAVKYEDGTYKGYNGEKMAADCRAKAAKLAEQIADLSAKIKPLTDEYTRRGGWTRAFLVINSNGHVHSSRNCNTCYPQTRYAWMTAYSGLDEELIVDAAGERACTVCYPSAPVAVLNKPTQMFSPDEIKAQAARDQRAAKKAIKDAAQVIDPKTGKVLFKTERAASNAILQAMADTLWYGSTHPSAGQWATTIITTATALAEARNVSTFGLLEELTIKANKKNDAVCRRAYEKIASELYFLKGYLGSEERKARHQMMSDPENWTYGVREWAKKNGKI